MASQLASFVKRIDFDAAKDAKLLTTQQRHGLGAMIEQWERQLRPLRELEPEFRGDRSKSVKAAFVPLGLKMRPDMAEDKAQAWTNTMPRAFADLPARCTVQAMEAAMTHVWKYAEELERFVRERATSIRDAEEIYIVRLKRLKRILEGDLFLLPDRKATGQDGPMTADEIRELVRNPGPITDSAIRLGVACGAIDATLLDQDKAEEGRSDEATA